MIFKGSKQEQSLFVLISLFDDVLIIIILLCALGCFRKIITEFGNGKDILQRQMLF